MTEELRELATWFKSNKLSLNISNTKIQEKESYANYTLTLVHIGNVPVKTEFITKFFGLCLMEIFPGSIINIVRTKVCKNIGIQNRLILTDV